MKKSDLNYNINNLITLKVAIQSDFFNYFIKAVIDNHFKFYKRDDIENPEVLINIGKFSQRNRDCDILDNSFYIKKNYFFCIDSSKFARWKIEVIGIETDQIIVNLDINKIGIFTILEVLIDQIIILQLNHKGYPTIHGSCISNNDQATIFSSQGGSGKTTIALNSLLKGNKFLCDDMTILSKNYVYGYLIPLNLFSFNSKGSIMKKLKFARKFELIFKIWLDKFFNIKITTKVNPFDLIDNIQDRSKLKAIYLLMPGKKFKNSTIKKNEIITHLIKNQMLELIPLFHYCSMYAYVYPDGEIANYWLKYESLLTSYLNETVSYNCCKIPKNMNESMIGKIIEMI